MNDTLWTEITAIFREALYNDSLTLTETTTAKDVDGWDSITHVMIMVALEAKFQIKFTAAEIQELRNVGDLAQLIRRRQAESPSSR